MYHFNTFHSKEYDKNILKLNLIRTLTNFNPLLLLLKQIIFFQQPSFIPSLSFPKYSVLNTRITNTLILLWYRNFHISQLANKLLTLSRNKSIAKHSKEFSHDHALERAIKTCFQTRVFRFSFLLFFSFPFFHDRPYIQRDGGLHYQRYRASMCEGVNESRMEIR